MTGNFIPTSTNMVNQVKNNIEGYQMGPIRALAQEPVQNSKDEKAAATVRVEYQLHRRSGPGGEEYYLLTITDSGTGGLKGPVLTQQELQERGFQLKGGENWAAFEGQGFTEKSDADLGSRGQGKSAALYHSDPAGFLGDGRDRRLMVYDTLLENGEYRMGVRYADPSDLILSPPLYGDDARLTVMDDYRLPDDLLLSLNLSPLEQVGARIIVPFLSQEALFAIRTRELHRWLQRIWWRAIQINELQIILIDEDGESKEVQVPHWWRNKSTSHTREYLDVPLSDGLLIKRVFLHYDPDLEEDEIDGYESQYGGVQLLRSQQWIETLDIREWVPREFRGGFRGFAEFDRKLEQKLKQSEKPQHERFDGRNPCVSEAKREIARVVREFAMEQGWTRTVGAERVSRENQEHAADFLATFAVPDKRKNGSGNSAKSDEITPDYEWQCELYAQFPDPRSNRVDWGASIGNVGVSIEATPTPANRRVKLDLLLAREGQKEPVVVQSSDLELDNGTGYIAFGSFQVVKGQAHSGQVHCPDPGAYLLVVEATHAGRRVATARKKVFVEIEPPPPPDKAPFGVSIAVRNLSNPGARRVSSGDEILIHITAKNRSIDEATVELDASLEDLLICDSSVLHLPGTPLGDTPQNITGSEKRLTLYEGPSTPLMGQAIRLEPGRHSVRVDLRPFGEQQPLAHASHTIFFEVSPGGQSPDLPFDLEAIEEEGSHPMWDLRQGPPDHWTLRYNAQHPIFRELPASASKANKLSGRRSFITEVCAAGLLEWALYPMQTGDSSKIDLLKNSAMAGSEDVKWLHYLEKLQRLEEDYHKRREEEPTEYDLLKRQTIADMVHIFEEVN